TLHPSPSTRHPPPVTLHPPPVTRHPPTSTLHPIPSTTGSNASKQHGWGRDLFKRPGEVHGKLDKDRARHTLLAPPQRLRHQRPHLPRPARPSESCSAGCRSSGSLLGPPSDVNSFHASGRDQTLGKPPAGVDCDSGRAASPPQGPPEAC
ncbi:hypothetical protein T484DRAFT_1615001, partial [Baffinella frigidus]